MAATCGKCGAHGVGVQHVRQCYGVAVDTAGVPVVTQEQPQRHTFRVGKAKDEDLGPIPEEDRVYLTVPYDERIEVRKKFGGKWDRDRKQWYVKKSADFEDMPDHWYLVKAPGSLSQNERYKNAPELEDAIYRFGDDYYMVYHTVHGNNQQVAKKLTLSEEEQDRLSSNEFAGDEAIGEWVYVGKSPLRKLTAENKLDEEEAAFFGQVYGFCGVCGRTLTNEESKKRGIGPVCLEKAGW